MDYYQLKSIVVFLSILLSVSLFAVRIYQHLWVNLRRGRSAPLTPRWSQRLKGLSIYVGGQLRLFRFPLPGISHFFIFWGFLVLSFTILQAIAEGLLSFVSPHYVLPLIGNFGALAFVQDFFALAVALAVGYALYVRLIIDPVRYQGSHKAQGSLVLIFILTIVLSLLVMNALRGNLGEDPISDWRPVSSLFGRVFADWDPNTQNVIQELSYWVHLGVVLLFLTELPTGKHFHVVVSLPAVFLRKLEPRGKLQPAPIFNGNVGVSTVEQFSWRQMLDFYTCTECGRCQEVCPAFLSGLPLSPKLLMMSLRDNLKTHTRDALLDVPLLGEVITEEELWACSTCYACDQECPLFIEHISPVVDMRCSLVIEGRVESELQDALMHLGRYGNSFGKSARARPKWSQSFQPKIKDARREAVEYLWYVGDYASFHPGLTQITQKTAHVFTQAGLDFGILYDAEQNAGNDVRRVGEDGLFEMLAKKNLRTLQKADFTTIVSTDPHTYNTILNEYPSFNGDFSILHYSQLLDQLINSGRLELPRKIRGNVAFHDPCYLGRYNGVYEEPRRVIEAAGCNLVELPRNRDRALCCGAGGGRIWMQEGDLTERPSEMRIREIAALGDVSTLVVACPKDYIMYQDALKTTGFEDHLVVKDLIELVHDSARLS